MLSIDPGLVWQLRSRVFMLYEKYHLDLVKDGPPVSEVVTIITTHISDCLKDVMSDAKNIEGRTIFHGRVTHRIDVLVERLPRFKTEHDDVVAAFNDVLTTLAQWARVEENVNEKIFAGRIWPITETLKD